jgi:deoxycytidylate deaminase
MPSVEQKFHKSVEIARALRSRYSTGRCFHITTAFDKNRLIAIGANNYNKTHPRAYLFRKKEAEADYKPSIHSELSAILKLGKEDCSDFSFFNVRIDKNGEINNSRPCSGCIGLMEQTGFKKLFYSTNTGSYKEFLTNQQQ